MPTLLLTPVHELLASRFYGNSAYAGGGLFETLVEGAVSQCAFEDNMAGNSGGGLSMSEGGGNIDNSIFINNQARRWPTRCSGDHAWTSPPSSLGLRRGGSGEHVQHLAVCRLCIRLVSDRRSTEPPAGNRYMNLYIYWAGDEPGWRAVPE